MPVDDGRLTEALAARPDVPPQNSQSRRQRARTMESSRVLADRDPRCQRAGERVRDGPGIDTELPFFTRNQGGIARATVEIQRASHLYAAARAQVIADVRSAGARETQAQQALDAWTVEIVPSLETEQRQAESAYGPAKSRCSTCWTSAAG